MADKRKTLFITPDFMDYTDIIYDGIEKYSGADVHLITTTGPALKFTYKNNLHRFGNFLTKLFGRNQKKIFYHKAIGQKLDNLFSEHSGFDDILILRPDLIQKHLPEIKRHGKRMIAYFWDSFARIPAGKSTVQYFDKFFSFEPKDVKENDLFFLPNFYSPDLAADRNSKAHFDLCYVASYDERVEIMETILSSFRPLAIKTNINILTNKTEGDQSEHINWLSNNLPRHETIRIMKDSIALLDIAQPKQEGLSFRFFEAMALEKKIITTNRSVMTYDFYNPNNIFVWENAGTIPSRDFFTIPYTPLSPGLIRNYSLENWVKQVFQ